MDPETRAINLAVGGLIVTGPRDRRMAQKKPQYIDVDRESPRTLIYKNVYFQGETIQ